jgi:hypothetical protein
MIARVVIRERNMIPQTVEQYPMFLFVLGFQYGVT